jgi:hypothetical protein
MIDSNNNQLNRNNMLLLKKMRNMDQMAHPVRVYNIRLL